LQPTRIQYYRFANGKRVSWLICFLWLFFFRLAKNSPNMCDRTPWPYYRCKFVSIEIWNYFVNNNPSLIFSAWTWTRWRGFHQDFTDPDATSQYSCLPIHSWVGKYLLANYFTDNLKRE
jgi:hypothetical protein